MSVGVCPHPSPTWRPFPLSSRAAAQSRTSLPRSRGSADKDLDPSPNPNPNPNPNPRGIRRHRRRPVWKYRRQRPFSTRRIAVHADPGRGRRGALPPGWPRWLAAGLSRRDGARRACCAQRQPACGAAKKAESATLRHRKPALARVPASMLRAPRVIAAGRQR